MELPFAKGLINMDVYNLGGRGNSFIGPKQTGVWAEQGMVFGA